MAALLREVFVPVRFSMAMDAPGSDPLGRKLVLDNWPEGVSRMSVPELLVLGPDQRVLGRLVSHASGEETLELLLQVLDENPEFAPEPAADPSKIMVLDPGDPAQRELAELESSWNRGERASLVEPLRRWLSQHGESWEHGAATVKTLLGGALYHAGDRDGALQAWQEVVDRYPDHPARHRAYHNITSSGGFPWLLTPDIADAPRVHPTQLTVHVPEPERRRSKLAALASDGRYQLTRSGLPLVRIEPGTFTMGGQPARFARELPLRRVTLTQPFWMAAWPVTYGMWRAFRPEGNPPHQDPLGDSLPWTHANVPDAEAFCRYLSDIDGVEYRLPTEAQWEYAARAGLDGAPYPWGFEAPTPDRCSFDNPHPVPVACYEPNAYGLFDMVGNWMEWTADPFAEDAYALTPDTVVDPVGTPIPGLPYHALRGGGTGLDFFKETCRNSFRVGAPKSYAHFAFRLITMSA